MESKRTTETETATETGEKNAPVAPDYRTPELRRIGSLDDVRGHGHHSSDHHGGHQD